MTFKPDPSDVKLCNRALSRLGQAPITALTPSPQPNAKPAQLCARWYKPTVGRLLEMHHWGLARKRGTMTEVDNDRSAEWTLAYALPNDCAFPVTLSTMSGAGVTYYQGLSGLLAYYQGAPAFTRAGDVLYSRFAGDLDYVSYEITEARFNATFENIVELTLAAAMAFDLTKSAKRELDLRQQATSAINIAITQNLNEGHPKYGDRPSERDFARGTDWALPTGYGWNWDWAPGPI